MDSLAINLVTGRTVITANRRLARYLLHAYDRAQLAKGKQVWQTPDILPWDAWLERLYNDYAEGATEALPIRLGTGQSQIVWEQVIERVSADDGRYFKRSALARQAWQCWELMHAWNISLDAASFVCSEDTRTFRTWARAYLNMCDQNNWLDSALLAQFLQKRIAENTLTIPKALAIAGFEEKTPEQKKLLDAFRAKGCHTEAIQTSVKTKTINKTKANDLIHELEMAARWARKLVLSNKSVQVAVVVPGLSEHRATVERIFEDILAPGDVLENRVINTRPFNISLGRPLSEYPMVRDALLILSLLESERIEIALWSRFLLSPYLKHHEEEGSRCAILDARLRAARNWSYTLQEIIGFIKAQDITLPGLSEVLLLVQNYQANLAKQRSPQHWASEFSSLLTTVGWPGSAALSKENWETIKAWHSLLDEFSACHVVKQSMAFGPALGLLRQLAKQRIFQPHSEPTAIQVLGLLETAGMTFSHLWVCGMDDYNWPPVTQPDPFIPFSLQRERMVPHASAQRELDYCRLHSKHLLQSSEHIVLSHAVVVNDESRRSSPLFVDIPETEFNDLEADRLSTLRDMIHADRTSLEWVSDTGWCEVANTEQDASGGTFLLADQAACPFRAFAHHRLMATSPESPQPGLDARARGSLVHRLLQGIWSELQTHGNLKALNDTALKTLLECHAERVIKHALKRYPAAFSVQFKKLEKTRLIDLAREWLAVELDRPPFSVLEEEQLVQLQIAGLMIRFRPDRIDQLDDGRRFVIDYKTGDATPATWFGDRPDQPQLPLYCISQDEPVAAAAFALIRRNECAFLGLGDSELGIHGVAGLDKTSVRAAKQFDSWQAILDDWRKQLTALAQEYVQGKAMVDPKRGAQTCRYCDVRSLCRIDEDTGLSSEAES